MKAEDSEEKLVVKKEEISMESGQSLAGLSDVEVRITVVRCSFAILWAQNLS